MVMTGAAVADRVKRQFGDESGVQVVDADIIRWINDAQREIARVNSLLQAVGTINVVSGQTEYPFPSNVLNLISLKYNGKKLQGYNLLDFEEYLLNSDPLAEAVGDPTLFVIERNNIIRLYPTPDVNLTNGLRIVYIARPTDIAVLGDNLTLPDEYFNRIVEYVLQQAYELDEDWNAAANKAAQFTGGLSLLQESQAWDRRETYPTITVLDIDD